MLTVLIIVLILVLIGGVPVWQNRGDWGNGPVGGIGLVLLIVVILLVLHLI